MLTGPRNLGVKELSRIYQQYERMIIHIWNMIACSGDKEFYSVRYVCLQLCEGTI
jgi:hypothetical protein